MANVDKSAFLEGKALKLRVLQKKKKKKISKEKECLRSHTKKQICQLDIDFEDNRDPPNILGISTFLSVFFPSGELKGKVLFLKQVFTEEKCLQLAHLLQKNDAFWTVKKDEK